MRFASILCLDSPSVGSERLRPYAYGLAPGSLLQVAELTAEHVVKRISDFKPTAERPFVLGLPTGSTPLMTYKKLVQFFKQGKVTFEHVVTFNMDE